MLVPIYTRQKRLLSTFQCINRVCIYNNIMKVTYVLLMQHYLFLNLQKSPMLPECITPWAGGLRRAESPYGQAPSDPEHLVLHSSHGKRLLGRHVRATYCFDRNNYGHDQSGGSTHQSLMLCSVQQVSAHMKCL